MANVYKYRLWCTTDSKWEYVWAEEGQAVPTNCPTNTSHTVDTTKTSIVETIEDKEIKIETEAIKTGGNTQIQSFEVEVLAGDSIKDKVITFPVDINLIRGKWFNRAIFNGDSVQFLVAENTVIGAITANVAQDDTVINVSPTVTVNTKVGYYIKCEGQDWGRVTAVDSTNGTITIENPATAAITATGTQYILQTVKIVPHLYLEGTETMMVLEGGIGSQYLPAGTPITIRYVNNQGTAKNYSAILEYFY